MVIKTSSIYIVVKQGKYDTSSAICSFRTGSYCFNPLIYLIMNCSLKTEQTIWHSIHDHNWIIRLFNVNKSYEHLGR